MDLGPQGELIFEDRLEARVAADMLKRAGRPDLIDEMRPPLSNPSISYLEFGRRMNEYMKGQPEEGIHRIFDHGAANEVLTILVKKSNLDFPFRPALAGSRRNYMGAKLAEFSEK